ncbi:MULTISPECIES: metal-dependent hydrolase [Niastella]|uniref:Metal-dependent hydrolase n=1 Tax=Niastella soli TaxID=2821487 RepID=A0ABS3Z1E8_9BACT|nr:metal-dependent hydrolase [Niastella soli]MBO9203973.1 metal-dependent hydrolase [Niastella soli]
MDSLTHIVLGACIGEVFIGKKFGKRALLLGAVAQSLPDIDFVASFWMTPTQDLIAHRGITHSLLFLLLVTPLLAWLANRWRRPHNIAFTTWLCFFATELLTHLALDCFNAYGTGLLEPFSHQRFCVHAMFVADPLFTILPLIVSIALLFMKTDHKRKRWAAIAIGWCVFYLFIDVVNKSIVEGAVKRVTGQKHITYRRHFTTPTPLNNLLWYVVLEDDKGYHIGYRSVFDRKEDIDFTYFPRNDSLLNPVKDLDELKDLFIFSQGYYTIEKDGKTLVFNDLRFGQMIGWYKPRAGFVFHYYLQRPYGNDMIVQRGRFANWDKAVFMSMLHRIKGE